MPNKCLSAAASGLALVLVAALSGTHSVSAKKAAVVKRFKVSVKTTEGAYKVGEIQRLSTGHTVVKGFAAPKLDALTDTLAKQWKAYKHPKSVVVSQEFYMDQGMRPAKKRWSFTFTKSDVLYNAAVVRKFVEDNGYETLGLSVIDFIEHDTEKSAAKNGEIIYDEPLKHYNFRKGKKDLSYYNGKYGVIIYAKVRKPSMGSPDYVFRASKSKPSLAVSQNYDQGLQEIGRISIHKDGKITLEPRYARDVLKSDFGNFDKRDRGVGVSVIENGKTWRTIEVGKNSPLLLEAYVVEILEHSNYYRVSPAIDPAIFEKNP